MVVLRVEGGINGKRNLVIQANGKIFSCELERPSLVSPAHGGLMMEKDIKRIIEFLGKVK